jgi:ssDNA-binding Zn-finger/Zn-ribbon topoisomerase 1
MTIATVTLEAVECPDCGCIFGMTKTMDDARRANHRRFYCPNGHHLSYPGESREEKLKRQLEQTSNQLANTQSRLEMEKRSKAAVKGQLTKTKKRVGNGVCPCCNRSFANLARHMHGQHPEYAHTQEVAP